MTIEQALAEFLREHRARGSRPRTVEWYGTVIPRLLQGHMQGPVESLSIFLVNRALNVAAERGIRPATLAGYDRALRGFTSWLTGVELLGKDPMQNRKRLKERWEPKQILTQPEIQALFSTVKKDKRYRDRNVAILFLLLGCGLRAGEVANLQLKDIDWDTGVIKVNGKTGFGIVPVHRQCLTALRRYATHSRKGQCPNFLLFNGRPITQNTVSHLIQRTAKRSGIPRVIGPHLLRHTFASVWIKNGGDAYSLQRMLRHSTPAMTMRYVHFQASDLQQKVDQFGVLAGLSGLL